MQRSFFFPHSFIYLLVIFGNFSLNAAEFNLVENPGFEKFHHCPYNHYEVNYQNTFFWEGSYTQHYANKNSDLTAACIPTWYNLFIPPAGPLPKNPSSPNSLDDCKDEEVNNSYVGFYAYFETTKNHRLMQYVGGTTKDFMLPNITYEISYDIALGEGTYYGLNSYFVSPTGNQSHSNGFYKNNAMIPLEDLNLWFQELPYERPTNWKNATSWESYTKFHYSIAPPFPIDPVEFFTPTELRDQSTQLNSNLVFIGDPNNLKKWFTVWGEYKFNEPTKNKYFLIGDFKDLSLPPTKLIEGQDYTKYIQTPSLHGAYASAYYYLDNAKITCHPKVELGENLPDELKCNQDQALKGSMFNSSDYQWGVYTNKINQQLCDAIEYKTINSANAGKNTSIYKLLAGDTVTLNSGEELIVKFSGQCHKSTTDPKFDSPFEGKIHQFKFSRPNVELAANTDIIKCEENPSLNGNVSNFTNYRWRVSVQGGGQNIGPIDINDSVPYLEPLTDDITIADLLTGTNTVLSDGSTIRVDFQGRCAKGLVQTAFEGKYKVFKLVQPQPVIEGIGDTIFCSEIAEKVFDGNTDANATHAWNIHVDFKNGQSYHKDWADNQYSRTDVSLFTLLGGSNQNYDFSDAQVSVNFKAKCDKYPLKSGFLSDETTFKVISERPNITLDPGHIFNSLANGYYAGILNKPVKFWVSNAEKFQSLSWEITDSSGTTIKTHDGVDPWNYTFEKAGSYTVSVLAESKNGGFCKTKFSIPIDIIVNENKFIPNVIKLNSNDPENSIFIPKIPNDDNWETRRNYKLQIFDRWGSLLFETSDPTQGWNGTAKEGREVNPGVFVYVITYDYLGNPRKFIGDVTVVR